MLQGAVTVPPLVFLFFTFFTFSFFACFLLLLFSSVAPFPARLALPASSFFPLSFLAVNYLGLYFSDTLKPASS